MPSGLCCCHAMSAPDSWLMPRPHSTRNSRHGAQPAQVGLRWPTSARACPGRRATGMPYRRVNHGPQRTTTVTATPALSWRLAPLAASTHPGNVPDKNELAGSNTARGGPEGAAMSSPEQLKSTPRYDRIVAVSRQIAWDLATATSGSRISSLPSCRTQTLCPPKSSAGSSRRPRLVLPSVTSSPRKGGAVAEATRRRPSAALEPYHELVPA
jgi:hypothetical protein